MKGELTNVAQDLKDDDGVCLIYWSNIGCRRTIRNPKNKFREWTRSNNRNYYFGQRRAFDMPIIQDCHDWLSPPILH